MFNWLNLSTKKSFSTEKGETMKTSKMSKQDRLVNALKDGEALTESAMKLGEAVYKQQQEDQPQQEEKAKDDNVVDADFEEVDKKDSK